MHLLIRFYWEKQSKGFREMTGICPWLYRPKDPCWLRLGAVVVLDEVGHDLDALEGLLGRGDDVFGRQEEAEIARVAQLDGVGVLHATLTLGPVVRPSCSSVCGGSSSSSKTGMVVVVIVVKQEW